MLWLLKIFNFKEVGFIFPMEEIAGGQLLGSIQGALFGDVKLVPGKRGRALYVNGIDQRVNLGNQRHNCMGDLNKCNKGFVMAMWIQMHNNDDTEYYISSGGQTHKSIGVAMMMHDKKLRTVFRTATHLWDLTYDGTVYLHYWYHMVLVWNIAFGGKVYMNGVVINQDHNGSSMTSNKWPNAYVDFILGDDNRDFIYQGEMTLDELRIWDAVMDDQDILGLYAADVFP